MRSLPFSLSMTQTDPNARQRLAAGILRVCFSIIVILSAASPRATADDRLVFFESKIRPIFERACNECHSGDMAKGGLRLTDRLGWQDAGVIQIASPEKSLLVELLRSTDDDLRMPPPDSGQTVTENEIRNIEQWIRDGAADPRLDKEASSAGIGPKRRNRVFEITPEDEAYWAFQPLQPPRFTESERRLTASEKIDELIRRQLKELPGVDLAPLATPRELARRASFDLWGLPPDPEIIDRLERDPSLKTWQEWIDTLLRSHHYGERWGRHWLDWVRFAETNGYERDGHKPHAWRYRDYVIESFAKDKPYDRFILEQLAGDEWAEQQGWSAVNNPDRWKESLIATGFYRLHLWDDEPDDSEAATMDEADDVMVSIGSAFLGLTIGCARCHDHKFDPIRQKDYYSMLSFLRGVDPYGLTKKGGGGRGTGRIQRFLVSESESAAWEQDRKTKIDVLQKRLEGETDPAVRLGIDGEIKALRDSVPPFEAALSVAEIGQTIAPTFVLYRGDVHSPREAVDPEFPIILQKQVAAPEFGGALQHSSGRRLQFAKWIASRENPLTARVAVNRIWQGHFGTGIVPTPDDFGQTGIPPSNLPLLDFLAAELIDSGWSLHHIHRIILSSHAYRMSSHVSNPAAETADPEARRFWRQNLRRLDAEAIRDSILLMAGNLGDKRSGPSVFPTLTQEVRDSANPVSLSQWLDSPPEQQNCRSVYLVVKRSLKVPLLESLDFANSSSPTATRPTTTTAPQALMLLNDPWVHAQADLLFKRLQREAGDDPSARIQRLWRIAYQRSATNEEERICLKFLSSQPTREKEANIPQDDLPYKIGAWQSLCRAILNSSEAIYID